MKNYIKNQPFVQLPKCILSSSKLTPSEKLVYAAMVGKCPENRNDVFIFQDKIATAAGVSRKKVNEALPKLESLGLINFLGMHGRALHWNICGIPDSFSDNNTSDSQIKCNEKLQHVSPKVTDSVTKGYTFPLDNNNILIISNERGNASLSHQNSFESNQDVLSSSTDTTGMNPKLGTQTETSSNQDTHDSDGETNKQQTRTTNQLVKKLPPEIQEICARKAPSKTPGKTGFNNLSPLEIYDIAVAKNVPVEFVTKKHDQQIEKMKNGTFNPYKFKNMYDLITYFIDQDIKNDSELLCDELGKMKLEKDHPLLRTQSLTMRRALNFKENGNDKKFSQYLGAAQLLGEIASGLNLHL